MVDNSEGDAATETVAREFSARYTVEPIKGLSRARNRGLTESTTDIVAYIDDDAVPDPDWLGRLICPFADAKVAAVTGRIVTPTSDDHKSVPEAPLYVDSTVARWFEIATFGGLGLGSNMAVRRCLCAGLTTFDARLGRGALIEIAEENYAFASLLSRGYVGVYLPDAIVSHPPLRHDTAIHEARNSFAYWLLLYSDFPERRHDLWQFLSRRLRRQPLGWQRDARDPGEIISTNAWVKLKAAMSGVRLFLRARTRARPASKSFQIGEREIRHGGGVPQSTRPKSDTSA